MDTNVYELMKKEYVPSKEGWLYQIRHKKTGAKIAYFDRADENKTFAVTFQTLPENHTGVFHILEHSVLNGSKRYPVKEPFVAMLQSSMQTFLNAMTFQDKTVYPVSSRNEQDLFHLMQVYLDGVFQPMLYERPEIFLQEGWHYEFEEDGRISYNGVVLSEMKGEYADVDRRMQDEAMRMLYPDTTYGYMSGGDPAYIPELSYEEFIETHERFYHPSNAWFIFDGHLDLPRFLDYLDQEYLSKEMEREPDFALDKQEPKVVEKQIFYEAQGEEEMAHLALGKILCSYEEVEKIFAAKVLADYLTGSNEAPLKRAILEQGLAQDIDMEVCDGVYEPCVNLYLRNVEKENLDHIKGLVPQLIQEIAEKGLEKESLEASLEHLAFTSKEVKEPYGIEMVLQIMESWLYGGDPLLYVNTEEVFHSLREKIQGSYFESFLADTFGREVSYSCLEVLPSLTKGEEDARKEEKQIADRIQNWTEEELREREEQFFRMQEWQMAPDTEEALQTLPHLDVTEISRKPRKTELQTTSLQDTKVLKVEQHTNGIVYVNLYFDISDFTKEELQLANVLASCFGNLRTEQYSGSALQTKIKGTMGTLYAKVSPEAKEGELSSCRTYFVVSASFLEEKQEEGMELLTEVIRRSCYDEIEKIGEILMQDEYYLRQSLVSEGHMYAIFKALSGVSKVGAAKEWLQGESYVNWLSAFVSKFQEQPEKTTTLLTSLWEKVVAFMPALVGYSGAVSLDVWDAFLSRFAQRKEDFTGKDTWEMDQTSCQIEIPSSVGFSAMGHNLYAMKGEFHGAYVVLSSLLSYGYLWNQVRVQGGAYGTGMTVKGNGDIFCYSYRDPDLEHTKEAFCQMSEFLREVLQEDLFLEDLIIGAVNQTDPLQDPEEICHQACKRYLQGVTYEELVSMREEILDIQKEDLVAMIPMLEEFVKSGKYCKVGE